MSAMRHQTPINPSPTWPLCKTEGLFLFEIDRGRAADAPHDGLRKHDEHQRRHRGCQIKPADIGGYFLPGDSKLEQVMRPSATFNQVLASLAA